MGLKYHTIIFVPHSRAKFRKVRISNRQVRWSIAALALLTVTALFVGWKSFTTNVSLDQVTQLQHENDELRRVTAAFEQDFQTLEQRLAQFEDKANSLAIVAGLQHTSEPVGFEASSRGRQSGGTGGDLGSPPPGELDLAELALRSQALAVSLETVGERLEQRDLLISSTPAILPAKGILTSRYGYRRDPIHGRRAFHSGIDISARPGSQVVAAADGIVARAGNIGSLGRAVYLSHKFGHSTRYGHLAQVLVKPGQKVKRGDVIGEVGNTGRATGYHLHYEVHTDGRARNPLEFVAD